MEDKCKIVLKKSINTSELAGEKVMVDFESGKYFLIKGAGNDIWDMIQTPVTYGQIIKGLLETYDVDEDTCKKTTDDFLNKLVEQNFVTVED